MIYTIVNSKVAIARTIARFSIPSTDWMPLTPLWVSDCLSDIGVYSETGITRVEVTVANNKFTLPCSMKLLKYVMYQKQRLPRINQVPGVNPDDAADNNINVHVSHNYELSKTGYCYTTFESGTVYVYHSSLDTELDSETNLQYPLIPDDDMLMDAMNWYILRRILEKGYKVPGYSLATSSFYVNPAMQYDGIPGKAGAKAKAINSLIDSDEDDHQIISRMQRSFILPNHYEY